MSDSIKLHTMDLFSRFFQENQEKFLTFAYSYLRDKAEAEDVLMESMIAPMGKPEPLGRRKQSACLAVDHNQKQVTQSVRAQKNTPASRRKYKQP